MLCQYGLTWFSNDSNKISVYHVLSVIRPEHLHLRIESDLDLSYYYLKKDFKGYMSHCTKLSEAFQLVENDARTKRRNERNIEKRTHNHDPNRSDNGGDKGKVGNCVTKVALGKHPLVYTLRMKQSTIVII